MRAHHRPDPSDPRPVRPCGLPPAGGRQIRHPGQKRAAQIPGPLRIPPGISLHDACRGPGIPERRQLPRGRRRFCTGVLPCRDAFEITQTPPCLCWLGGVFYARKLPRGPGRWVNSRCKFKRRRSSAPALRRAATGRDRRGCIFYTGRTSAAPHRHRHRPSSILPAYGGLLCFP